MDDGGQGLDYRQSDRRRWNCDWGSGRAGACNRSAKETANLEVLSISTVAKGRFMWFLSLFTVVGSGLLLGLSFFPGLLEQVPRKYSFAIGGLYIGFALAITLRHLFQARAEGIRRQRIAACLVLLSLVLTPLVLASHIPRRLLFQQYQGDFEALLPDAPPAGRCLDRSVERRFRLVLGRSLGLGSAGRSLFSHVGHRAKRLEERLVWVRPSPQCRWLPVRGRRLRNPSPDGRLVHVFLLRQVNLSGILMYHHFQAITLTYVPTQCSKHHSSAITWKP